MKITIEMVMDENPCRFYNKPRVSELWNGREYLKPSEVAALDIPVSDRAWLLGRMLSHCDPTRFVARRIVKDVIGDRKIPADCRAWLDTGDKSLMGAVMIASWDAAAEAARGTITGAGRDAAIEASWDAVIVASWHEADDAVFKAARYASRSIAMGASGGTTCGDEWNTATGAAWKKYTSWMVEFLEAVE